MHSCVCAASLHLICLAAYSQLLHSLQPACCMTARLMRPWAPNAAGPPLPRLPPGLCRELDGASPPISPLGTTDDLCGAGHAPHLYRNQLYREGRLTAESDSSSNFGGVFQPVVPSDSPLAMALAMAAAADLQYPPPLPSTISTPSAGQVGGLWGVDVPARWTGVYACQLGGMCCMSNGLQQVGRRGGLGSGAAQHTHMHTHAHTHTHTHTHTHSGMSHVTPHTQPLLPG